MTPELQAKFVEINRLLKSVLIATEIDNRAPSPELKEELGSDLAKVEPLLPALEDAIQKRLHYAEG